MNEHDDAYVDAMLMVNMQANTRSVTAATRYSAIEKLCLCLYFSCIKLRHYLLSAECTVICKDDVVRYMLSMLIMSGRIGKWILALSEFDLR